MSTQGYVQYTEVSTQIQCCYQKPSHVHHVIPHFTHGISQCTAHILVYCTDIMRFVFIFTHPGVLHRHYTFCFHFLVCENESEELLTVYTKTNKSAALFLGTRSESEPESCKGSRREQVSDRWFLGDVEYQEPVVPKSETWRDILKQSSEDQGSLLLSDQYNRSLAATSVNTSHFATFANVNPYASQNQ